MIFDSGGVRTAVPTTIMMRSVSPALRSCSPAISEISVGSPSPPPIGNGFQQAAAACFRPLNAKRLRLSHERPIRSPLPQQRQQQQPPNVINGILAATPARKSSLEGVKSFSIAHILGTKGDDESINASAAAELPDHLSPPLPVSTVRPNPTTSSHATALPPTPDINLHERLQPIPPPLYPLGLLELPSVGKLVPSWDPLRGAGAIPLRPLLPPVLLHEQRFSWDYQRQLQEHFQAQAQLLRQMSMDPTIIPSEDGSERSRSSSTGGSECNSPEVDVQGNHSHSKIGRRGDENSSLHEDTNFPVGHGMKGTARKDVEGISKETPADTPLDALFQLSTKNFDEQQDPATLNIFATRPNPKKKRKSRTAFTNHQIFELEKRFLYQKYLSPADRDEIAAGLGLSNAQVITWFQNRRAKLKRDMEELKRDVESAKQLPDQSADSIQHRHQHQQHPQRQQQPSRKQLQHLHFFPYQQQLQQTRLLTTAMHQQHRLNRDSISAAAEDKKELKMLKMMTLMYYSGCHGVAAATPAATLRAAAAPAVTGDDGNPAATTPDENSADR